MSTLTAFFGWGEAMPTPVTLLWVVVGLIGLGAAARGAVRWAGAQDQVVVVRLGRRHRVRGPGPVLLIPGVERALVVSTAPARVDHLQFCGTTRDGGAITVEVSLAYQITDAALAVALGSSPVDLAISAVERSVRRRLGELDLRALAGGPRGWVAGLAAEVNRSSRAWGVHVSHVEVASVDLRLTSDSSAASRDAG